MNEKLYIRRARLQDANWLAIDARQSDVDEIEALGWLAIDEAVRRSIMMSDRSYSAFIGKRLLAIGGIERISSLLYSGRPWLVGTTLVDERPGTFMRGCRPQLARLARGYAFLENYVYAENGRTINWLQRLGFTVHFPAVPYGIHGKPFYRFTMGER